MKSELHAKGVRLTNRLRTFIEDRIRFTTGRFHSRIQRLRVRLADVNGPRGGEDIQCHVHASLGRAGTVTIKETCHDPYAAVARAIERTGRQLSRRLSRRSAGRRGR